MSTLSKIIVVLGPTASGKTGLSLEIAREIGGEVISADSRTIYRGMDIGTAKVEGDQVVRYAGSQDEGLVVEGVAHWGIDLINPDEDFTVVDFKEYAEHKIDEIRARGHVPMIVGGTGLYIRSLVENFGFDQSMGERKYDALQIGLKVEREKLYERIDARVDKMMDHGLLDEVRALKEVYGCDVKSMTGIGYRQLCEYLEGDTTLKEAVRVIKRDSRHYAKRQMTWFARDEDVVWIEDGDEALKLVQKFLSN